jgi:shikimate kinase
LRFFVFGSKYERERQGDAMQPIQPPTVTQADVPAQTFDTVQPPASLQRIALTGFMGAGKSTVGRLLAARLGWSFVDLDAYLEQREGLSVPEIFARHGEAHFRRVESRALASALGRSQVVLALGGGTPEILTNRLLLEQTPGTTTVFLDAPFPTLFDRCVLQEIARPVMADPTLAEARFRERQPLYRRLARHTVDTSDQTPETTVQALLAALDRVG